MGVRVPPFAPITYGRLRNHHFSIVPNFVPTYEIAVPTCLLMKVPAMPPVPLAGMPAQSRPLVGGHTAV
jgi:hypothetical protein